MTQTLLYSQLEPAASRIGPYNGVETSLVFRDAASELHALQASCGIFDLGWRAKISVAGKDRVRWLHNMVSNNVRDLPLNRGNYNFVLNAQGRILADMFIFNRGESLLIDTDRSQVETVINTLKRFIIMDKVELADCGESLSAIGICGPRAQQILVEAGFNASGMGPMEPMESLELREQAGGDAPILLVSGPSQQPGWYELWANSSSLAETWKKLASAGAQPVGAEAVEMWRVLHGVPKYGQDIRDRDLPQETEQVQALNFTKGCYIGQEIVERIRSRGQVHRKFTGFEFHGSASTPTGSLTKDLPQPGKFEENGRTVAEITSVAVVPTESGERHIALGYVRREAGSPGSQITLNGRVATVVDLPFDFK